MANVEYICTQCWHSFEEDAESVEAVICPSCGAEQPQASSATDEEPSAEHIAPAEDEAPAAAAEESEPVTADGSEETDASEEESDTPPGDPLEGVDTSKCGWRVRSGGLTYNFHGVTALQNWCSGKKGLEGMEVSIEDTGIWVNLQEFRQLLRKQDAMEAFRSLGDVGDGTSGDAVSEEAPAKKPMEPKPKEEKSSSSKSKEPKAKARRDSSARVSKPSVRSTGEFTFKVGDAPASSGPNWVAMGGGFVVGLLFGLALWYLGVLSALDTEPLGLF